MNTSKEIVTAESNLNGKKTRKTPVPANEDRIREGALKLSLGQKIALRDTLHDSIQKEMEELEERLQTLKKAMDK